MQVGRSILFGLVLLAFFVPAFSQVHGAGIQEAVSWSAALSKRCSSGVFAFRCPKDYKVLLSGKTEDRLFLAENTEFRYAVFVVSDPGEKAIADSLPKIVETFLPKMTHNFRWKDVEADPRKSSKFEIESKRQIAINSPITAYLTLEYRVVEFKGKRLLTGTIVDGYEGPEGIAEDFETGVFTTNGGCFDSLDIIAAFTKEKLDAAKGPCFFTLEMS